MQTFENTEVQKITPNMFDAVLAASVRTYQLRRGRAPTVEPKTSNGATALNEILSGTVSVEDTLKDIHNAKKRR